MQENLNEVLAAGFFPMLLHLVQSLRSFSGVGSINIEEADVAAGFTNVRDDLLNLRHIRPAIKMHTQDIESTARQLQAGGGAETARRTDNQAPWSGANTFRHNQRFSALK